MSKSKFEVYFSTIVLFAFLSLAVFVLNLIFFNTVVDLDKVFYDETRIIISFFFTGIIILSYIQLLKRKYTINGKLTQASALKVAFVMVLAIVLVPMAMMYQDFGKVFKVKKNTSSVEYLEQNFDQIVKESDSAISPEILKDIIIDMKRPEYSDWVTIHSKNMGYIYRFPSRGVTDDSGKLMIEKKSYKYKSSTLSNLTSDNDSNEMYDIWIIEFDNSKSDISHSNFMAECFKNMEKFKGPLAFTMENFSFEQHDALKIFFHDVKTDKVHTVNAVFTDKRVFIMEVLTDDSMYPNQSIEKFMKGLQFK